jgi:hypothetical protein
MSREVLFERDLLYPTENLNEPGSVHIKVFSPNSNATIPVLVEGKSNHAPLKYIDVIANIMQIDIFDRIQINVRKSLVIYIPADGHFTKVQYVNDSYVSTETDAVELA